MLANGPAMPEQVRCASARFDNAEPCALARPMGRLATRRPRPGEPRGNPIQPGATPRAGMAARSRNPLGPHPGQAQAARTARHRNPRPPERNRPPSRLADTQQARTRKEWVTSGCVVSTPRYTSTTDTGTGLEPWHRRCVAMVAKERPQTHHCPCVGGIAPYTPCR